MAGNEDCESIKIKVKIKIKIKIISQAVADGSFNGKPQATGSPTRR